MRAGAPLGDVIIDGAVLLLAGALLLLPGIVSDMAGLLLLIPPVRWLIVAAWKRLYLPDSTTTGGSGRHSGLRSAVPRLLVPRIICRTSPVVFIEQNFGPHMLQ